MTKASYELVPEEAHLIATYRAIKDLNHDLVQPLEAGEVLQLIREVLNLEEATASLNAKEVKQLLKGFIAGVVGMRSMLLQQDEIGAYDFEPLDEPVGGSYTNAIPAGQETGDPRYVAQSGVRAVDEG